MNPTFSNYKVIILNFSMEIQLKISCEVNYNTLENSPHVKTERHHQIISHSCKMLFFQIETESEFNQISVCLEFPWQEIHLNKLGETGHIFARNVHCVSFKCKECEEVEMLFKNKK